MTNELKTTSLFDIEHTILKNHLAKIDYAYQIIEKIPGLINALYKELDPNEYDFYPNNVAISKGARVDKSARIEKNTIICADAEIRHCAYIRKNALIGNGCVIGNSSEIKNAIIFDYAQIPHFNYVGDSVVGYKAHLGAGVILSNLRSDKRNVKIGNTDTGLRKFGSLIGDGCEIGCGCVLNPGTVVGKRSTIYPLSSIRGIIYANTILKNL